MPPPPNIEQLLQQLQFPGMPQPESDVAMLWLQRHGREYDAIEFNVRLGEGQLPLPGLDASTARLQRLVTQKRADIIVTLGDQATIIEAKIRAGLGAIGQLTGYRDLYARDNPDRPAPRLLIIAKFADPDVQYVASQNGIDLLLFERATPQPTA